MFMIIIWRCDALLKEQVKISHLRGSQIKTCRAVMSHASHPLPWHCSWVVMVVSKLIFCTWSYLYFSHVLYLTLTEMLIPSAISFFQVPFSHKALQLFAAGTRHHLIDRTFHKISGSPSPENLTKVNSLVSHTYNILAWINTSLKDRKVSRHKYLTLASGGRSPSCFLCIKCLKQEEALNNNSRCWMLVEKIKEKTSKIHCLCAAVLIQSLYFSFAYSLQLFNVHSVNYHSRE